MASCIDSLMRIRIQMMMLIASKCIRQNLFKSLSQLTLILGYQNTKSVCRMVNTSPKMSLTPSTVKSSMPSIIMCQKTIILAESNTWLYNFIRGGIFSNTGNQFVSPKNLSNGIDFGFLSFKLPIPSVSLHLGPYLKGECMNQKAKPHKQS